MMWISSEFMHIGALQVADVQGKQSKDSKQAMQQFPVFSFFFFKSWKHIIFLEYNFSFSFEMKYSPRFIFSKKHEKETFSDKHAWN